MLQLYLFPNWLLKANLIVCLLITWRSRTYHSFFWTKDPREMLHVFFFSIGSWKPFDCLFIDHMTFESQSLIFLDIPQRIKTIDLLKKLQISNFPIGFLNTLYCLFSNHVTCKSQSLNYLNCFESKQNKTEQNSKFTRQKEKRKL